MSSRRPDGPVPSAVPLIGDELTVQRAWPHDTADAGGDLVLTVEGTDGSGRVRAARLAVRPAGDGTWTVQTSKATAYGDDRKLPQLAVVAADGALLVHRYGKRAVVRRAADVVKIVRAGRADEVADRALRGRLLATEAGLDAPDVLARTSDSVTFSLLPGQSLHDLGSHADDARWSRWWSIWSQAWPSIAQSPTTSTAADLPQHTPVHEAGVLRRWVDLVDRYGALDAAQTTALNTAAERTIIELTSGAVQPLVVSHRDLHDKQLLAHNERLGLLDFDTAALSEPALDLANLHVHASLRVDQGLWPRSHGSVVHGAVKRVAGELGVDPARFATYSAATRLRLICIYAFRPRYRHLAAAWADQLRQA